jgi:hypothetical protein
VYCIVFSGSVWVLQKRRRGAESQSQTISPVIEVCSWFIFLTLTIVRIRSSSATIFANGNYPALRNRHILPVPGSSRHKRPIPRIPISQQPCQRPKSHPRGHVWALRFRDGGYAGTLTARSVLRVCSDLGGTLDLSAVDYLEPLPAHRRAARLSTPLQRCCLYHHIVR